MGGTSLDISSWDDDVLTYGGIIILNPEAYLDLDQFEISVPRFVPACFLDGTCGKECVTTEGSCEAYLCENAFYTWIEDGEYFPGSTCNDGYTCALGVCLSEKVLCGVSSSDKQLKQKQLQKKELHPQRIPEEFSIPQRFQPEKSFFEKFRDFFRF